MLRFGAETARHFAYIIIFLGGRVLQSQVAEYFVALAGYPAVGIGYGYPRR